MRLQLFENLTGTLHQEHSAIWEVSGRWIIMNLMMLLMSDERLDDESADVHDVQEPRGAAAARRRGGRDDHDARGQSDGAQLAAVQPLQHAVPQADPEVGHRSLQHQRDPRTLAHGPEPLGLSGGRLRRRRHRQTVAQRGSI